MGIDLSNRSAPEAKVLITLMLEDCFGDHHLPKNGIRDYSLGTTIPGRDETDVSSKDIEYGFRLL